MRGFNKHLFRINFFYFQMRFFALLFSKGFKLQSFEFLFPPRLVSVSNCWYWLHHYSNDWCICLRTYVMSCSNHQRIGKYFVLTLRIIQMNLTIKFLMRFWNTFFKYTFMSFKRFHCVFKRFSSFLKIINNTSWLDFNLWNLLGRCT